MPISFLISSRVFSFVAAVCIFLLLSNAFVASFAKRSLTLPLLPVAIFVDTDEFDCTSSTIACKTPGNQRVTFTFAPGWRMAPFMTLFTSTMRSSIVLPASSSEAWRKESSCTNISVMSVESTPRGCHERLSITSSLSEESVVMIFGTRPHVDAHWIWIQRKTTLFASISSLRRFSCSSGVSPASIVDALRCSIASACLTIFSAILL
mmetsp:Transcript_37202/g.77932  ORF Transcript_37202/g.77932 Transcript_37202/m.77932 type:complete len:207 (+) Transcript_37202:884-1504(+)